jgi:hypothetical protein
MQVKPAADFVIADALHAAAPTKRVAGTEGRGFSRLDARRLCFAATN